MCHVVSKVPAALIAACDQTNTVISLLLPPPTALQLLVLSVSLSYSLYVCVYICVLRMCVHLLVCSLNLGMCPRFYLAASRRPAGYCFCRASLCICAAIAVMRCPSVRLSRSWIMSKRINIPSKFFHHRVATPF